MKLPPSDRLEVLVEQQAAQRDYVAYLVRYDVFSGLATINTRPGQTTGILVNVTATLKQTDILLTRGAQVHVRRIGSYPPVITEVIPGPATQQTAFIEVVDPRSFGVLLEVNETSLHLTGWGADETVDVTFYGTTGLPLQSSFGTTIFISTQTDGTARSTFFGLFAGLVSPGTLITVRAVGEVSRMYAATSFILH